MTKEDSPFDRLMPPFARGLGVVLTEARPDLVTGTLTVTPQMSNRNGVMHGGAIMAFADTLGGVAASLNLDEGQATTTLESKTNFLRPIRIGQVITGRCEVLHGGRTVVVLQVTLLREDGARLAITTQTQMTLQWTEPADAPGPAPG